MQMPRDQRRLAAIVSADVVGYSRLMGRDESGTLAGLKAHRRELIDPKIAEHGGRIVKTTGDGLLLEFASVVDAVRWATEVQRGVVERNSSVPEDQQIRFRVGINVGDIIIDDDDIFGDGVNVATRLQTLAQPGGICVSRGVRDQVLDKLSVVFEDLGEQEVKNILRPIEVFQIADMPTGVPATVPYGPDAASIAVLPFVNMSHDAENEYFSDGVAEELLNVLTKISGLRVAARTSSFQFKGKNDDIGLIGRKLRVKTILEGSVRKVGNRVRITVQLVKVADGFHLWSETYDRTLDDIFAVQDDIAQSVVKKLRMTLPQAVNSKMEKHVAAEVAAASKGRATDPEAHRLYLQARYLVDRLNREDMANAIEHLKEALAREPEFALAWAELARAYWSASSWSWVPVAEGKRWAREAVGRALALEPDLAEGHANLGWMQMLEDHDWRSAEASLRRALELAPADAAMYRRVGALVSNLGRLDEAIALDRRAVELDPLSTNAYNNLGNDLYAAGRLADAETAYRKALELSPQRHGTRAILSLNVLAQGRVESALSEALREPEEWARLGALAIIHHAAGRNGESDAALQSLIVKYHNAPTVIASVYAARCEADLAFSWLGQAYGQGDVGLAEMLTDPNLRSLHGDSRWVTLVRKMGFSI
jgi:adenylate cyclase